MTAQKANKSTLSSEMGKLFLLAVAIVAFFASCNEDPIDEFEQPTEANLTLTLHHQINDESLVLFKSYVDQNNRKFNVTQIRYYLSNIRLIKDDFSEMLLANQVLVKPELSSSIDLGTIFNGNYRGIKFEVGVAPDENHLEPTDREAGHPLELQSDVNMHFGQTSRGYIFLKLDGEVDTSVANTGNINHPWSFDVGGDQRLKTINISKDIEFNSNEINVNVELNFEELLKGINLRFENYTNSWDNMFVANKIANNIPSSFTLLKAE